MIVRKSFQFRLKHAKKQAKALESQPKQLLLLDNELLQQLMFLPDAVAKAHERIRDNASWNQFPLYNVRVKKLVRREPQYRARTARNFNAAQNILVSGLKSLGAILESFRAYAGKSSS